MLFLLTIIWKSFNGGDLGLVCSWSLAFFWL
jgi:hypothetical protein